MFKVYEMMGNFGKKVAMFETEVEANDYLFERWEEAKEEALLFHDDLNEDAVMELFLSYFSIEDDGREPITHEALIEMYDGILDECYPEMFNMSASTILYRADRIAYDCGLNDCYDSIRDEYYCDEME